MTLQLTDQQKKDCLAGLGRQFMEDFAQAIKQQGYFMCSRYSQDTLSITIDYFPTLYEDRKTGLYDASFGLHKLTMMQDGRSVSDYELDDAIRQVLRDTVQQMRFDKERNLIITPNIQ